jgi:hypothetical protein
MIKTVWVRDGGAPLDGDDARLRIIAQAEPAAQAR